MRDAVLTKMTGFCRGIAYSLVEEMMEMKLFCNLWSGKQMCTIMIIFNVTK